MYCGKTPYFMFIWNVQIPFEESQTAEGQLFFS